MKYFFAVVLALMSIASFALNDTIRVTQYKWEAYDWVDTCTNKYAVVHGWDGSCGIYDLEKHENLTEMEYRELSFLRMATLDDGIPYTLFNGKKGRTKGLVYVSPMRTIVSKMELDDELTYSLNSCNTIDQYLSRFCRELLKKDMQATDTLKYGQVLVMDTNTGDIKAWVALENNQGEIIDATLRKNQCSMMPFKSIAACFSLDQVNKCLSDTVDCVGGIDSIGGIKIMDHSWYRDGTSRMTYKRAFLCHSDIAMAKSLYASGSKTFFKDWQRLTNSPRMMDAMEVAAFYSSFANGKFLIRPSVKSCEIRLDSAFLSNGVRVSERINMWKELMKSMMQESICSNLIKTNVDISGDFVVHRSCVPTLYDDNATPYNQIMYIGYLPSDSPRYTIFVSVDADKSKKTGAILRNTVNGLAEYLSKGVEK